MHILIVRNNSNEGALAASDELVAYFEAEGITYSASDSMVLPRRPGTPVDNEFDQEGLLYTDKAGTHRVDLVVVLGGDGTVLKAARMVGTSGVPILGVNFGHLGFLSNPGDDGVVHILKEALAGRVVREDRANLHIEVSYKVAVDKAAGTVEQQALHDRYYGSYFALNELAVTRGNLGHVVGLSVAVDGNPFSTIRGDGVVVASSTGSTAYALSAGGPLVAPTHAGMVVVPLAPHTLHSRAVVTAPSESVTVELFNDKATQMASLFVDGELLALDGFANSFRISAGERPTTLLRYGYDGFYAYAAKTFL